jgi:hypothetical protein
MFFQCVYFVCIRGHGDSREVLTELFPAMLGLRSAMGVERVVSSALQDCEQFRHR